MPQQLTFTRIDEPVGPQQPAALTFERLPEPDTGGLAGFGREFWKRASPIQAVKGIAEAMKHPVDAAVALVSADPKFLGEAKARAANGDYLGATRKVMSYLAMGFGHDLDAQADLFEQGRTAEGLGATTGIATALVAPVKGAAAARAVGRAGARVAANPIVREAATIAATEGAGQLMGVPAGVAGSARLGYDLLRQRMRPTRTGAPPAAGAAARSVDDIIQDVIPEWEPPDVRRARTPPETPPAAAPPEPPPGPPPVDASGRSLGGYAGPERRIVPQEAYTGPERRMTPREGVEAGLRDPAMVAKAKAMKQAHANIRKPAESSGATDVVAEDRAAAIARFQEELAAVRKANQPTPPKPRPDTRIGPRNYFLRQPDSEPSFMGYGNAPEEAVAANPNAAAQFAERFGVSADDAVQQILSRPELKSVSKADQIRILASDTTLSPETRSAAIRYIQQRAAPEAPPVAPAVPDVPPPTPPIVEPPPVSPAATSQVKPARVRKAKPAATPQAPAAAAADVNTELRHIVSLDGAKSAGDVFQRVTAALKKELPTAKQAGGFGSVEYRPSKSYGGREGSVWVDGEMVAFTDRYGNMKWADDTSGYTMMGGKSVAPESSRAKIGFKGSDLTPSEHGRQAVSAVAEALTKERGIGKITIEIPGDGTFTIPHTPHAIQSVLDRITKGGPMPWQGLVDKAKRPTGTFVPKQITW